MRNEWKDLAEKLLFDFGKTVLGKNAGGVIVKLLKARGIDGARLALIAARDKQDPREYIGASIREKEASDLKIGETLGGYVWNGSRWAEAPEA